jgi:hypothetical protein
MNEFISYKEKAFVCFSLLLVWSVWNYAKRHFTGHKQFLIEKLALDWLF